MATAEDTPQAVVSETKSTTDGACTGVDGALSKPQEAEPAEAAAQTEASKAEVSPKEPAASEGNAGADVGATANNGTKADGQAPTEGGNTAEAQGPEVPAEADSRTTIDINVTIAGQSFPSRSSLQEHVRTLQESLPDDKPLAPEDALFMFHLASFLPEFESKLTAPVIGFKYGPFSNSSVLKCFFLLRSDGTEESLSVKKCLDGLYAASLPKNQDSAKPGTKRPREPEPGAAGGPAEKKQFKMRPGCIVLINGIPGNLPYAVVKTKLQSMGDCRFVELESNKKPKKKGKGKGKGKAKDEDDDDDSEDEDVSPVCAKARFGDAEVAASVAKELKQLNGHPVTAKILEGQEEIDFWEQLLERSTKIDAKGKGKGKGKGKK